MVAKGNSQRIRCIKTVHFQLDFQYLLEHLPDLFLAGISIAGDRLLYFPWCIFGNRNMGLHGSRYGHSLCAAELEHALYILTKERGFNGKLIRLEFQYDLLHGKINQLKPLISIHTYGNMQCIHFHVLYLLPFNTNQPPAHLKSAGVNAQDYFGVLLQRERYF